jgi:hypothetical protein
MNNNTTDLPVTCVKIMKQSHLLEKGSHLTFWLTFKDDSLTRRHEEYAMTETPLFVLLVMVCLATIHWVAMISALGSEMSLWPSVGIICAFVLFRFSGFLYCYTVWIFQAKRVISQSSTLTGFNQFVIRNIRYIGNAFILTGAIACGLASLFQDYNPDNNDDNKLAQLSTLLQYRNFASLLIIPVIFPIHSFVISLLVIPLFVLVSVLSASSTPFVLLHFLVPFALVLYFIQIGNKKRFLIHMELEETRDFLAVAEANVQRTEAETTDMHHMIGTVNFVYTSCNVFVILCSYY